MTMRTILKNPIVLIFCLLMLFAATGRAQKPVPAATPVKLPAKSNQRPAPPKPSPFEPFKDATVEAMAKQCVTLETEAGNIAIEMFPESAPESVRSFLNLSSNGFYETTTFSRVVPGFIIQGGDLSTRSKMTMEYAKRAQLTLPDEPSQIKHERGIISMARGDEPHSANTNFFILVGNGSHLDGSFAAFGRVTSGMDVVDAINKMPVENDKPAKPVHITKTIVAPCQMPVKTP